VALIKSRTRFRETKKRLHFADNMDLPPDNKMAKLRSILRSCISEVSARGMIPKVLSVDEQMV